jgi:hypothetical protein
MKIRRLRKPEVTREQVNQLQKEFDKDALMDLLKSDDRVVMDVFIPSIGQQSRLYIELHEDMTWDWYD